MKFTAVYRKVPEGYIGFVEELPGANTQGKTLDEVRVNIREAIAMTLEANRLLAEESVAEIQERHHQRSESGGRSAVHRQTDRKSDRGELGDSGDCGGVAGVGVGG